MKNEFVVFKSYQKLGLAEEIVELLHKNDIETRVGDNVSPLGGVIIGDNSVLNQIDVKIKQSDFTKAQLLLGDYFKVPLNTIDKNHYLFKFSDDELCEIISKPDEWGDVDYSLAKQLLEERGKTIDEQFLVDLKQKRIEELSKPENSQTFWIVLGYILVFFGGLLGFFIGYSLYTFKKTLPNGERVYSYNENDRKHGKNILILGIILMVISLVLFLNRSIFK